MDIRQMSQDFSVSPQITLEDIETIRSQGFRSIICNRPDNEDPGQPSMAEIRGAAETAGLSFIAIPMSNQIGMTRELVEQTSENMKTLPAPILAYCRSGTRSAHLYLAAQRLRQEG